MAQHEIVVADGIQTTRETRMSGADLHVGDTIETWAGLDTIIRFEPYTSPMAHIFKDGARVAIMARNPRGILINNGGLFEVTSRALSQA